MKNIPNISHTEIHRQNEFEKLYIEIRKKERRIYSNKEVSLLPEISKEHLYYDEWRLRKKSSERLIQYLGLKKRLLKVLEVGCGNGWLSYKISIIKNTEVTGIDINGTELNQAREVFSNKKNLSFFQSSIETLPFESKYDIIVFAASIQYFPSIDLIIKKALRRLNENGEIHILDSPLYKNERISEAKDRSDKYFRKLEVEHAVNYYYHHSLDAVKNFNHRVLYKPHFLLKIFSSGFNPFYWIYIKK